MFEFKRGSRKCFKLFYCFIWVSKKLLALFVDDLLSGLMYNARWPEVQSNFLTQITFFFLLEFSKM
jgi:hypothetical protein